MPDLQGLDRRWQTDPRITLRVWSADAPQATAQTADSPPSPVAQVTPSPSSDPELGTLRVKPSADPELGVLRLKPIGIADPELGIIRLRYPPPPIPVPPPPPPSKSLFLFARVDYLHNSNVLASTRPIADGLVRSGLTVFYAPAIGPQTFFVASIDTNLIRYTNVVQLNYDELRFRVGVSQRLSPRMYGEIGWTNQQLFASQDGLREVFGGNRFLNDNAVRLEFSRQDPLTPSLTLSTYYQLWASFTSEIKDYNRLVNAFEGSLSYGLSPSLQVALDYQVFWTHFTQQSRDDLYQQVGARLSYLVNPRMQLNLYGGRSFGSSSDDRFNFGGWLFGVGVTLNVPLL